MNLLTGNKTLVVGALSLIGAATASIFAHQQSDALTQLTHSAAPAHIAAINSIEVNSYILQGGTQESLLSAIEAVGATISKEFPIINAVSAVLTGRQAELLAANHIIITSDREIRISGNDNDNWKGNWKDNDDDDNWKDNDDDDDDKDDKEKEYGYEKEKESELGYGKEFAPGQLKKNIVDTYITTQTNANKLHRKGILGKGVTIAVLDSGTLNAGEIGKSLSLDSDGKSKDLAKYNSIDGSVYFGLNDDTNGHGTHVSSIIGSSLRDEYGNYNGMAPDANLLSVKAFDEDGNGSYSNVLDGLNWIFENRKEYDIRVLNLSIGAEVNSNYWNDPINQAVMRLWDEGIVVVTSAGNTGSDNTTITVPGNVPYIITVGAVTDSYTPYDTTDDRLTTFSAQGPTHEGFVKPELVAYGGHIEMKMDRSLLGDKNWFSSLAGEDYYGESGTSQSAAMVTGIVALMLDKKSGLKPDEVKCRLMASAKPISDPATNKNYSPFAQGAGLVNAYAAVMSKAEKCANQGLKISDDIKGKKHFRGPALVNQAGELMIDFGDGNLVAEGSVWGGGTNLEGSVWGGGTNLEGSVWGGGTMLEGSVWGDDAELEGSVWGDDDTELEGSVWGGGTILEGSVWGGGAVLEGSIWGNAANLESVRLGVVGQE